MRIQPSNTGVGNLSRPVDVVSFEENNIHPEDSFYYIDFFKFSDVLQYKYFKDIFSNPQDFEKERNGYFDDLAETVDPKDYINITLKELIEDFKDYIKFNT
jgi:hypothetical protein